MEGEKMRSAGIFVCIGPVFCNAFQGNGGQGWDDVFAVSNIKTVLLHAGSELFRHRIPLWLFGFIY